MTGEILRGAIQIIFAETGLGEASGAAATCFACRTSRSVFWDADLPPEQDFLQGPTARLFRLFLEPIFRPPQNFVSVILGLDF